MSSEAKMRARFRGALLGCVAGDAVGRMLSTAGPWRYGYVAETTIAVADSLVRKRGVVPDDILSSLSESFDSTRSYSSTLKLALEAVRAGRRSASFSSWQEGSHDIGGAARVAPIACLFHDDPRLSEITSEATGVTHDHPRGRAGAIAMASAIAYVLGVKKVVPGAMFKRMARPLVVETGLATKLEAVERFALASARATEAAKVFGNGPRVEQALPLALFCFLRWAPNFEAVVTNAIQAGGEVDAIASMAGALCGALAGESVVPRRWLDRLDDEPKGPDYIRVVADSISALYLDRCR